MKFDDLAAMIRRDLALLDDALRWAWNDGHWQTNATPRPPKAPRAAPSIIDDPDRVPGPRHDIGIGSHRRRAAYHAAVTHLDAAEKRLTVAAALEGHPMPRQLAKGHDLDQALAAITYNRRRIALITSDQRGLVRGAAKELDQAVRLLNDAFAEGEAGDPTTHAVAEDPCKICSIRPRADRAGGRCNTCATWFHRNGYERPTKLDAVHDAHTAARRRRQRGEGWGEA